MIKMKVTVEISEMLLMKSIALADIDEEKTERILSAARETTELDLNEILRTEPDLKDTRLAIGIVAVGALLQKLGK